MKKTLIISASILLILTGCSSDNDPKNNDNTTEQISEKETLEKLAEDTAHFSVNYHEKEHLKQAYPGTDYYVWAKNLIENGTDMLGEDIKTKVLEIKVLEKDDNRMMTIVTEESDIPTEKSDVSINESYYFFKKYKGEWKIYGVSLYDKQLWDLSEQFKNEIWTEMGQ